MSTFFGKGYVEEDYLVKGIREITDALLAFNSAINFLLYCSLSAVFRNTFTRVFFGRRYARIDRLGSHRNFSRDGTSGGTSLKRRISHREVGGVKIGRKKDKSLDGDDEFEDLMKNGGDYVGQVPTCSNGHCTAKMSSPEHICSDMATRSTSPGSASTDNSSETAQTGPEASQTHNFRCVPTCSAGTSSSSSSSSKNHKLQNLLCDVGKIKSWRGRVKKDKDIELYNTSRLQKTKNGERVSANAGKPVRQKPSADIDRSYLTSSVYLGPTTEVLPFEFPKRDSTSSAQPIS
ncbi:hypothetical protein EGW08_009058 [Elysia chlorotica]|uniref:Uncharacterized protein n=1 Tax=Elysia chlorotica TaxID=188477 RepID=A0A433TNN5_ELYCH|nr:hypothetical protein EGW08_009058 [Elysia chlorotica]